MHRIQKAMELARMEEDSVSIELDRKLDILSID